MSFIKAKKAEVTKSFIRPDDFDSITNYCRGTAEGGPTNKRAIGFREAGEETIKRLNDGATAKGHDILEKSIKDKSMGENIINIPDNIKGLVGCWGRKREEGVNLLAGVRKELKGIYITSCFREYLKEKSGQIHIPGDTPLKELLKDVRTEKITSVTFETAADDTSITVEMFVKCLEGEYEKIVIEDSEDENLNNMRRLGRFINEYKNSIKEIPNIYHCFYTGDYDLHEIITYTDEKAENGKVYSKADMAVIEGLNEAIKRNPAYNRKNAKEFNVVRHGPQCGYLYYAMNHAGQQIGIGLLRADLPVAVCDAGEWYILKTEEELTKFYNEQFKLEPDGIWVLNENISGEKGKIYYLERLESWIVFKELRITSQLKKNDSNITESQLKKEYEKIEKFIKEEIEKELIVG